MKLNYPKTIETTDQLNELLSAPTDDVVAELSNLDGDIIILGAGGKIGPSLARMAKRASDEGSTQRKIIGVSLFESDQEQKRLEEYGIETIHGNIIDRD
ncbi:epimerase, partial [candidate division KSB1 bacterium]|nr:epimerase [candidate division KSB1 bacterium]